MRGPTPRKLQKHLKIGEKQPKNTPNYLYISIFLWTRPGELSDATSTRQNARGKSLALPASAPQCLKGCADMGFDCFLGKEGGSLRDRCTDELVPLERHGSLYVVKMWARQDPTVDVKCPLVRHG